MCGFQVRMRLGWVSARLKYNWPPAQDISNPYGGESCKVAPDGDADARRRRRGRNLATFMLCKQRCCRRASRQQIRGVSRRPAADKALGKRADSAGEWVQVVSWRMTHLLSSMLDPQEQ